MQGELDLATVPLLRQHLALIDEGDGNGNGHGHPQVILDLRGLTFMDSTGWRAVLDAARDASERGRLFTTVGVTDSVRKLFEITGTVEFLNEAEALGLIQRFMRPDGAGAAE